MGPMKRERESWIFRLPARLDDIYIYIYIYIPLKIAEKVLFNNFSFIYF